MSRGARYKILGRGPEAFNIDNAYLLSGDTPPRKQHAFHSAENIQRPSVIIKLEKPTKLTAIKIVNRQSGEKSLLDRASGLTVSLSSDANQWLQVWQAPSAKKEWSVPLSFEEKIKFIKVELDRVGTLHLNQIVLFGAKD